MAPSHVVKTTEELRAIVGDPLRAEILGVLTKRQASVKELAEELGERPQRTHYHTKQLEKAGLVRVVETREVKGIVQKLYRAIADRFVLSQSIGELPDAGAVALELIRDHLQHGIMFAETAEEMSVEHAQLVLRTLAPATAKAFAAELKELVAKYTALEPTGERLWTLGVALYEVAPDSPLPSALAEYLEAEPTDDPDARVHIEHRQE
jgi:DNA-binding transcriptional ArsR family regulator